MVRHWLKYHYTYKETDRVHQPTRKRKATVIFLVADVKNPVLPLPSTHALTNDDEVGLLDTATVAAQKVDYMVGMLDIHRAVAQISDYKA